MVKKIAISGYYGFRNLGDEAILYSMIETFRSLGDVQLVVLSNDPSCTERQYGVKAVNRWKLREVFGAIRASDILLSGGGSLLQDVTGAKSVSYYLGVIALAKLLRKKVMLYAQGIGPVHSDQSKLLIKYVLNKVDLITVRDPASKNLLIELGVKKPEIKLVVDAVLGFDRNKVDKELGKMVLETAGIAVEGAPLVGVSLRDWQNRENYMRAVASTCDKLIEMGYRVVFLPFHFPRDIAPARDTIKMMRHSEQALLLKQHMNVQEMLGVLSGLHMMIGMRLHSLIMGAVMLIPVVGISYDPKIDGFMKAAYQPLAGRAETITEEELWSTVEATLNDREKNILQSQKIIDEFREQALDTARMVMDL